MKYLLVITSCSFSNVWASKTSCREFEFVVRQHNVKAHNRKGGAKVSVTERKAHCRVLYPRTENWIDSFRDTKISDWPYEETFKGWSYKDKEIVLKLISQWPNTFTAYDGLTIYRADTSKTKGNPAAILPKSKAIVLYDEFFRLKDQSQVFSHEMAHLHILSLDPEKLRLILKDSGWDYDKSHRPYWSEKEKSFEG